MTTPTNSKTTTDREAREERTLKIVRRIGYVVLFGTALGVFAPIIIGVGVGIKNDRMWDPFTGHVISRADSSIGCLEEAQHMIVDTASDSIAGGKQIAGQAGGRAKWDQRFSLWIARCRSDHGDVYDILRSRRDEMREDGRNKSPKK